MPSVQFIKGASAWSIPPTTPPATIILPAGAAGGMVVFEATSDTCVGPGEGVIFELRLDGMLVYTTACMVNGTDSFPVPPLTGTINVQFVAGCNGGIETTTASFSGAGP